MYIIILHICIPTLMWLYTYSTISYVIKISVVYTVHMYVYLLDEDKSKVFVVFYYLNCNIYKWYIGVVVVVIQGMFQEQR